MFRRIWNSWVRFWSLIVLLRDPHRRLSSTSHNSAPQAPPDLHLEPGISPTDIIVPGRELPSRPLSLLVFGTRQDFSIVHQHVGYPLHNDTPDALCVWKVRRSLAHQDNKSRAKL